MSRVGIFARDLPSYENVGGSPRFALSQSMFADCSLLDALDIWRRFVSAGADDPNIGAGSASTASVLEPVLLPL